MEENTKQTLVFLVSTTQKALLGPHRQQSLKALIRLKQSPLRIAFPREKGAREANVAVLGVQLQLAERQESCGRFVKTVQWCTPKYLPKNGRKHCFLTGNGHQNQPFCYLKRHISHCKTGLFTIRNSPFCGMKRRFCQDILPDYVFRFLFRQKTKC